MPPSPPPRRLATAAAVASALIGLAASLAALVDDVGGLPTFCAESGCDIVRHSAWARPLGIPMSVLGVAFFATALVLSVIAAPRLRRVVAIAGGAWAIGLIAVQAFAIGAWCKLCLVADPAAILHAIAVVAGARALGRGHLLRRAALAVPALAAIVLALGWWTRAPAVALTAPAAVATTPAPATDGAVEIVEYVDFECPFCRQLQGKLDQAIARTRTPVRVVRKMVPLPMHAHAEPAALAWCCADAQGKGDEMARALFAADPATLTAEGCAQIAARIGCDMDRYHRDLAGGHDRIKRDMAEARAAGVRGLPTMILAGEKLTGADHTVDDLVAKIEAGARRP